jgi:hypothetical protein
VLCADPFDDGRVLFAVIDADYAPALNIDVVRLS